MLAEARYAVITPARNEEDNLPRLAASLMGQSIKPDCWIIVDNASTDRTYELARDVAAQHTWVRLITTPETASAVRGRSIVKAFHAAIEVLGSPPPIVVSVDADVSVGSDYFEQLIEHFRADPSLGMASGLCYEQERGSWRPRFVTGSNLRGATRAYRWDCLKQLLPLEERYGWDGLDSAKANSLGWKTATFSDLSVFHHRTTGARDRSWRAWLEEGSLVHYMGYRPSYVLLRTMYRAVRQPTAVAMPYGYVRAAVRREPRCADSRVVAYVRSEQRLRCVHRRIREAFGS